MSARFADLMALSATQTRESDMATKSLLSERRRKEEIARKEQEEKEKKEREARAKLLQKRLEEERKEQERKRKAEEERQRLERTIQRREEEQRNHLLYGPKKATKLSSGPSEAGRFKQRREISDDEMDAGATALTREEKRQRRFQMEIQRSSSNRRTASAASWRGRRLAGGAIDAVTPLHQAPSPSSAQSIKQRLAAQPNTLTKLNVVKRDTRTIDEILQDRAKAKEMKTLDGDDARDFHDWFGKPKKKDPVTQKSLANTPSGSPSPAPPAHVPSSSAPVPKIPRASDPSDKRIPKKTSAYSGEPITDSVTRGAKPLRDTKPPVPKATTKVTYVRPTQSSSASVSSKEFGFQTSRPAASSSYSRKRTRSLSPSLSPSPPPPPRKRPATSGSSSKRNDISSQIWSLFGKNRSQYVNNDVYSDDEDMEADVDEVMEEEMRSTRFAKREDEIALAEERRHEEEKRRKKKERDMRERY